MVKYVTHNCNVEQGSEKQRVVEGEGGGGGGGGGGRTLKKNAEIKRDNVIKRNQENK